jgi:hypothetical protein
MSSSDQEKEYEPKIYPKIDADGLISNDENIDSEMMTPRNSYEDSQNVINELSDLMKALKKYFGKINDIFDEVVNDVDNTLK